MNLNKETFINRKGDRQPYSTSMIWYASHLRYASLQVFGLFFEKFPVPTLLLLNKVQQGGVNTLKALKTLMKKAPFP